MRRRARRGALARDRSGALVDARNVSGSGAQKATMLRQRVAQEDEVPEAGYMRRMC